MPPFHNTIGHGPNSGLRDLLERLGLDLPDASAPDLVTAVDHGFWSPALFDSAARGTAPVPITLPGPLAALNQVIGDAGDNVLTGTAGGDLLYGSRGLDTLDGGAGTDLLVGGRDADLYVVSTANGDTDVIYDRGNAPVINGAFGSSGLDELRLTGLGTTVQAMHSIGIRVSGNDLIFTYDSTAPGGTGQVIIRDHFAGPKTALEQVSFGDGSFDPVFHIANLSGDQFTYSIHSGPDQGGEDIVLGTNGNDQIYGGIGNDIYFGGAGADHFMFQDEGSNGGGNDIILDFDPTVDKIDYTEIKTLTRADVTVSDSAWGNALITTAYGSVELDGVAAVDVTDGIFAFF